LHSCNNQTEEQVTVEDTVQKPPMTIDQRLAMYANITLKASVDSISDKEKQVLGLLFKACDVMNDIFWLQSYGNKEELFMTIGDEKLKRFTEINYGPWDRFNDSEPFIEGIGKKPIGAAFYPPDIKYLPFIDMKFEDKLSMFTVIKRADDGSLYTQPYKTAYKDHLEKASGFISEAAKITEDKAFAKYLNLLSEALVTDNYYEKTLTYQNQIDEAERSKEIDKEIRLEYSGNQLKIVLPDSIAKDMNNGEVYFYRPSDSNMDFTIPLRTDKNSELVLDASKIDKGYWKVQMKWLMKEERYSVERTVMVN
jgi:nitrogen fixation protein FixH